MNSLKKYVAEVIGTFVLVFFGCGVAVMTGADSGGPDLVATSLAFGLTIVAMAYTVGHVSGCHLNPAVSLAMFINKRLSLADMVGYMGAQVIGAVLGSALLKSIAGKVIEGTSKLGTNGVGDLGVCGAFGVEVVLTFVFILVIVAVTSSKKGNAAFAGLVIGLTLTLIHLMGIGLTGTSVNPARSLGPALLVGGDALKHVWVFLAAPLVGGALAAFVGCFALNTEE